MRHVRLFAVVALTVLLASGLAFAGGKAGAKIGDPISSIVAGLHQDGDREAFTCESGVALSLAKFVDEKGELTAVAYYDTAGSLRVAIYDSTHSGDDIVLYGDQNGSGKITAIGEPEDETFGHGPCAFFE